MSSQSTSTAFTFDDFNKLIRGIEMLYAVGRRLSDAVSRQPCEFLIQEASMAFVKTIMSLLGFLRFIPSSRFFAGTGDIVVDLSSASVMGRQVLEDIISYFYLSEPNLSPEEKNFRELVWRYHGSTEHIESAKLAQVPNPERSPKGIELEQLRQQIAEHPLLAAIEDRRHRDNIRSGYEGHILSDQEILKRREIRTEHFKLPHKVLSNFAHFSKFSHDMMMDTSSDWQKSDQWFIAPSRAVANFAAELFEAFLATFPQIQTRQLLSSDEQSLVEKWRAPLRDRIYPLLA